MLWLCISPGLTQPQVVDWEVDLYLFLLVGLFPLNEYYIEKNVNSRYIWGRVIPVPHSENLFFQYRFIYFIHFSCFNFSFFTGLRGKSRITQMRNHLSSPMLKLWSLNCLITIRVFWFSGNNYNFYIFLPWKIKTVLTIAF